MPFPSGATDDASMPSLATDKRFPTCDERARQPGAGEDLVGQPHVVAGLRQRGAGGLRLRMDSIRRERRVNRLHASRRFLRELQDELEVEEVVAGLRERPRELERAPPEQRARLDGMVLAG